MKEGKKREMKEEQRTEGRKEGEKLPRGWLWPNLFVLEKKNKRMSF